MPHLVMVGHIYHLIANGKMDLKISFHDYKIYILNLRVGNLKLVFNMYLLIPGDLT